MKKSIFKKLLITVGLAATTSLSGALPKEYYDISTTKESKKYFFEYFYNLIEKENIKILQEREFVKNYLNSNILNINYSSASFKKLLEIKRKYRIKSLFSKEKYLRKIDIVPPSMALAQAAVESGWGRSRFIKEANNVFGHWTYNPKIGMMPLQRDEGARHFIRVFKTVQDSISAYMLNLNRNRAYKLFQDKRYEQREKGMIPQGMELSQTMLNYSGIGHNYLEILNDVINKNNLINYDKKFYTKIKEKK